MAPITRTRNKLKHPGLPDIPTTKWEKASKKPGKPNSTAEQRQIIERIATLEDQLLTKQNMRKSNASQPPSPSVTKKP
ncbi:hypothetical protein PAXRUDRAFT_89672, partial [Paxillus rubicundulus Ve08.2h10]